MLDIFSKKTLIVFLSSTDQLYFKRRHSCPLRWENCVYFSFVLVFKVLFKNPTYHISYTTV